MPRMRLPSLLLLFVLAPAAAHAGEPVVVNGFQGRL